MFIPPRIPVGAGKPARTDLWAESQSPVSPGFLCGSEPAREGVRSATSTLTDTPHSRAGSLPQVFCGDQQCSFHPESLWELACQRLVGTSTTFFDGPTAIAGKPAPTSLCAESQSPVSHGFLCGSEPAREGGGSATSTPTDTPLSRAGSLRQCVYTSETLWEQACSQRNCFSEIRSG